jgi:hypothetical protein
MSCGELRWAKAWPKVPRDRGCSFTGHRGQIVPGTSVVDENAILVHLGAQQLGYLPRQVAQLLAPEMDAGRELVATVAEIEDDDGLPSVAVVIAPT